MYQDWVEILHFLREHQNNMLREAERARAVEAARRSHKRPATDAALGRVEGRCVEGRCVEEEGGAGQ